jgi:hypothetical protein
MKTIHSLLYSITCLTITCISSSCIFWGCTNSKEVTYDSGGVSQTFTVGKQAVPRSFPLPIYPNAKASGSVSAKTDDDENSTFLMLSSNDSVSKVAEFYIRELKQAGWTISENQLLASLVNISGKKNDLEASVMISAAGNNTSISLSVNKELVGTPKEGQAFTPDKLNPPTD